ncbi:MAG: transketolase C-terminal domain-containing protein, partial [Cycloclasticus pugetii]
PIKYHAIGKLKAKADSKSTPKPTYSNIFGHWLCDMAEQDSRLVGVTPAMREGSDLIEFSKLFPERYYDVAIAEQHSVCLGAGFATQNSKPVIAIYSTFLQRAYDQVVHDVCVQGLDVTFAIDRAGLVGPDGPTHAGSYDFSYLRCIPNMVIMAPADENECRLMLTTGIQHKGPVAVRYPRGKGPGVTISNTLDSIPIGKAVTLREGKDTALLAFGSSVTQALEVAEEFNATVINMRFIKPLDEDMIKHIASTHNTLVTLEENVIKGGAGSGVNEFINQASIDTKVLNIGLPDLNLEHGSREELLQEAGLDTQSIKNYISSSLNKTNT